MKYALDTSVLVRILSNRPQPLAGDVIRLVAARIGGGDTMAVVLSEAYEVVAGREGCVRAWEGIQRWGHQNVDFGIRCTNFLQTKSSPKTVLWKQVNFYC